MKGRRGFTLIELLVSIAIIALLSSVVLATLTISRVKARDAQRITQAQQIAKALEASNVESGNYFIPSTGLNAKQGSGYVGKTSTDDASYLGVSVLGGMKTKGLFPTNALIDPIYGKDNYYLAKCALSNEYTIYLKVEQPALQMASSTLADGCDGANAVTLGFNYAVGAGGIAGYAQNDVIKTTNTWTGSGWLASGGPSGAFGTTSSIFLGSGMAMYAATFDGTNIWTANYGNSSVSRITPAGTFTTFPGTGLNPFGIAFDGTNVWTANSTDNSVTKVSPSGVMTTYTGTGASPYDIAFDGVNMWVTNSSGNNVTKVTPAGVMTTYPLGLSPRGIAFDGTSMWIVFPANNAVVKVSSTGVLSPYYGGTGTSPMYIAFDGVNMWTSNAGNDSVTKVSPAGVMTTYVGTGASPRGIVFDGTNMWTVNNTGNSVTRVTPAGVMTTYPLNSFNGAFGLTFDGTRLWAASPYNVMLSIAIR